MTTGIILETPYDTHYMKASKEFKTKNSELNMIQAEN